MRATTAHLLPLARVSLFAVSLKPTDVVSEPVTVSSRGLSNIVRRTFLQIWRHCLRCHSQVPDLSRPKISAWNLRHMRVETIERRRSASLATAPKSGAHCARKDTMLRQVQRVAVLLLTAGSTSVFAGAIFTDSTFNLANYSTTAPFTAGGATLALSQCPVCGNSGTALDI